MKIEAPYLVVGSITYSVPNLEFHVLVLYGDRSRAEFNSYGQVVCRLKSLVCELKQKARLSHA